MYDVSLFAHKLLEQLGHDGGSVELSTHPQALDLHPIDELHARFKGRIATDYRDFVAAFFQVPGQVVDACFGASAPRRKETVDDSDSHGTDCPRTLALHIGSRSGTYVFHIPTIAPKIPSLVIVFSARSARRSRPARTDW